VDLEVVRAGDAEDEVDAVVDQRPDDRVPAAAHAIPSCRDQTRSPPTQVSVTTAVVSASSGAVTGSTSTMTRSARAPTRSVPMSGRSSSAAGVSVMPRSAADRLTPCSPPPAVAPPAVRRVTAAQAAFSGPGMVTGASEEITTGTPARSKAPYG